MQTKVTYLLFSDSALKVSQVIKGEMSAKTTSRKSFKGLVAVSESAPDGKFILLENVGRRVTIDVQTYSINLIGPTFSVYEFCANL